MARIAFFTAAGFFGPPNRRTSLWYRAGSRPWVLTADQAAAPRPACWRPGRSASLRPEHGGNGRPGCPPARHDGGQDGQGERGYGDDRYRHHRDGWLGHDIELAGEPGPQEPAGRDSERDTDHRPDRDGYQCLPDHYGNHLPADESQRLEQRK